MQETEKENILGTAKIGPLLFKLSLPAITAQIINMLYNIVDRIYIGHIPVIGATALTGVGVTFSIIMLISAFASLIGMGGAPQAAIKLGEGNKEKAEEILGNCFAGLIAISIVLTVGFLMFKDPILLAFGASPATLSYGSEYITIYLFGTIFVELALGLNMFITSQGFAKTSMIAVLIGAVINIVLDPILIFTFKMGVQGAALATIVSQGVSAVFVLWFLFGKKTQLKIKAKYIHLTPSIMLPVLALGVSPFIMSATEAAIAVCFNISLLKYGGDLAVGTMTILMSLMQLVMLPLHGMTQGAQPIVSYNFGAKKIDRVKLTFKYLFISCLVFTLSFGLLIQTTPTFLVKLFSNSQALTDQTVWAVKIYMAATCIFGAQIACQQTFIAIGQAKISLFLALLRKIILLIPLIFIMPLFMQDKLLGVFLAEPIADLVAVIVTCALFAINIPKIFAERLVEQ